MTVTQELPWGGREKLVFLGRKDKGFCTWNIKSHPKVSKVQFTKNEEITSIRWGSDGKKLFCGLWYDRILDKGSVKMNYMRIKWPSRVAKQQQQLWWLTASLLVNINEYHSSSRWDKKDHSSNETPLLCLFAGNDFLVWKLQLHAASANWKMLSSITFCLSFVSFFFHFIWKLFGVLVQLCVQC